MPTSNEELKKMQNEVQHLREQIANERSKKFDNELNLSNEITANALKEEQSRLQAELAALKGTSSAKSVRESAAAVLDPDGTAERVAKAAVDAGAKQPPANPKEK